MHAFRLLSVALMLAVLAPAAASAQEDSASVPRGRRVEPVAGVRAGFPQKLSAYVGLALAQERFQGGYSGWSLTVEPGLGGGLVALGRTIAGPYGMTVRAQAAALRTWGDPWLVGPGQTYLGLEGRMSMGYIGFTVGGFVRVPQDGAEPAPLFSAGLVLGN